LSPPPIELQKAYVEWSRKASEALSRAATGFRIQQTELDRLADSIVFASLKSSRCVHLIGNVLDEIKNGIGSDWKKYPVLGATRSGLAPAKEPPGKFPERYRPVTAGTVFYNPMRILIGSIAFLDENEQPGITSPDYVVLKGRPGIVDSRWFYYWLRSPLGERCIQSLARGAVRERMLFNRLAEGEIELPDYVTQVKASRALAQIKSMRAVLLEQVANLKLMPEKFLAQVLGA
jgi:type I restriction enzyme, S subunit